MNSRERILRWEMGGEGDREAEDSQEEGSKQLRPVTKKMERTGPRTSRDVPRRQAKGCLFS